MAEIRRAKKLIPDEAVKAAYRAAIRALRDTRDRHGRSIELEAQIEFLERIYSF